MEKQKNIIYSMILVLIMTLIFSGSIFAHDTHDEELVLIEDRPIISPDGKYKAIPVDLSEKDRHYEIINIRTGKKMFMTSAQYETANDVKGGKFSPDSKKFAATYHYGHEREYTWVGVWSIKTGELAKKPIKYKGHIHDINKIPDSIFQK